MKKSVSLFLYGSILFLLIPYVFAVLLNGSQLVFADRQLDVEKILPIVLAAEISEEYEVETIKAQAVIARSNLYRRIKEGENMLSLLGELPRETYGSKFQNLMSQKRGKNEGIYYFQMLKLYESAAKETEGMVLSWENRLVHVPYHQMSSGKTRDGAEVFHSDEYKYLVSVNSDVDKKAEEYLCGKYVLKRQMPRELVIAGRDSAGYVTELQADGKTIEGETFREGLSLPSSSFTIQVIEDKMRFLCRGKGHGLGFSQYGGNEMARQGSTYMEILAYYFPKMQLGNIDELLM